MPGKPLLLLATNNKGKLREYRELLKDIPFKMVSLADQGITAEVAEIGKSFEENATLKATTMASLSGLLTLADDSGLEVDVLDGEPGSRSHRYAGDNASDADRVNFLLQKLKDVSELQRTAQFRCVIAIAEPTGRVELCSGICRGVITTGPRGSGGFGYDPIFYLPELGKTIAELTLAEKNLISHRARAAEQARAKLLEW
ncbi:MAG: XTP/dITP diphosphatase [Dehalococcoidales bacterium]|jgi:XTP/dITP diphosphohydrolase